MKLYYWAALLILAVVIVGYQHVHHEHVLATELQEHTECLQKNSDYYGPIIQQDEAQPLNGGLPAATQVIQQDQAANAAC